MRALSFWGTRQCRSYRIVLVTPSWLLLMNLCHPIRLTRCPLGNGPAPPLAGRLRPTLFTKCRNRFYRVKRLQRLGGAPVPAASASKVGCLASVARDSCLIDGDLISHHAFSGFFILSLDGSIKLFTSFPGPLIAPGCAQHVPCFRCAHRVFAVSPSYEISRLGLRLLVLVDLP